VKHIVLPLCMGIVALLMCLSCSNSTKPELLSVALPEILPAPGTYSTPQLITISCSTEGASIYYSVDGSDPNEDSVPYTVPLTISESATIKARAYKPNYQCSAISSGEYSINLITVGTPTFDQCEGCYQDTLMVTVSCATEGATIRYTLDGSEPTAGSTPYEAPLTITQSTLLGVRAFKDGCIPSVAVYALYDIDLTPPMEMVMVPEGAVEMGDTKGEGYNDDQYPVHTIHISSFFMGKYEVKQSQYRALMGSIPNSSYGEGNNYPVYNVNWYTAIKYCNLLSLRDGYTPVYSISGTTNTSVWGEVPLTNNLIWNSVVCDWNANGYRLPTEAEWEYAARGASSSPDYTYSGSNNTMEVGWCMSIPGNYAHEVGLKAPNSLGIYDMSGNVFELCWDWYWRYSPLVQYNPHGPNNAVLVTSRIIRSGAWDSPLSYCSVCYRSTISPHMRIQSVGFRVCRNAR